MKTTRLLITVVALGAFALGPGFAVEPSSRARLRVPAENRARKTDDRSPGARHTDEGPAAAKSGKPKGTKTTAKPHPAPKLPQSSQANGAHPGEKPTNDAQTKGRSASAPELHQPGMSKSAAVARTGSMINETANQRRLPMAGLAGSPMPRQVARPWASSQGFIGGPTVWSAKNTAVIGGTGMRRRP